MTKQTASQDSKPTEGESTDVGLPHPLDEWLKRELGQLYVAEDAQRLPPEIEELAHRLDRLLGAAKGDATSAQPAGSSHDRPQRDRQRGNV